MALRRWKPFLGAFAHIDAAIEVADADGLLSRDEFRSARAQIVEMLCDAGDDDEKAEGLCAMLDEAMAGSLATLRVVPPEMITPRVMACGDLIAAIGALATRHSSEQVRGLARDVACRWRAGIEARARVAMDLLDGLRSTRPPPTLQDDKAPSPGTNTKQKEATKIQEEQQPPHPRKKTAIVSSRRVNTTESYAATSQAKPTSNMEASVGVRAQPKKPPPIAVRVAEEQRMDATKRKLHVSEVQKKMEASKPKPKEEAKIPEEQQQPHLKEKTSAMSSRRISTEESYRTILAKKTCPVVATSKAKPPVNMEAPTAVPAQPKKQPPVAVRATEEQRMEATKRKLHERYQEAEDAKRRRTIQVIKPPRPPARRPASCAAERGRFMKPSSSLRMGV